jgi:hypothetical protein
MTEVIWGDTPKKRQRKEEKYSTPVVTLGAIEKVGAARKISFNKAAQELLEIKGEDTVLFGFTGDNSKVFLKKSFIEKSLKLTQTCTLSDKKVYEQIIKTFGFNLELENELDLLPVEGESYFELTPISELIKTISESQKESTDLKFDTTNVGIVEEEVIVEIQTTLPPVSEEVTEKVPLYERLHGKKVAEEGEIENFLEGENTVVVVPENEVPTSEEDVW